MLKSEGCRRPPGKVIIGSTLLAMCIAGAVGGVFAHRDERKRQQGASAPDIIKGKSGDIMSKKAHGTCLGAVQSPLRWACDWDEADKISCFNRHWAEHAGYWETTQFFIEEGTKTKLKDGKTVFYDSVTSEALFQAPVGRSWDDFVQESLHHGWPSFRDEEVLSDRVRVLEDGETVSVDGTHLGHNLPDNKGNRYCINLVSVAGFAPDTSQGKKAQISINWNTTKK